MATWIIDTDHSVVRFSIWHFKIANVINLFSRMTGIIQFDPPDIDHLSIEVAIEVQSLTTSHQMRDEHLFSPNYFDIEKFPKIIYRSIKVEHNGGNYRKMAGELTMHGTTRPVTLEVEIYGPVKSQFTGKSCIGFIGRTKINLEDYGIKWSKAMEGISYVMGKGVQINFDIEAILTNNLRIIKK
jgi:polyisoprenoid-binding protein YceI